MIEHVSVGVSDLGRAGRFYDTVLAPLGYVRLLTGQRGATYGPPGAKDESFAIVVTGAQAAPPGDVAHVAFKAPSRDAVEKFHAVALHEGAKDEGTPGPRPHYGPTYFAAFVRDPDGNRLEAVYNQP